MAGKLAQPNPGAGLPAEHSLKARSLLKRATWALLLLVLLTCLAPRLRHLVPTINTVDFNVYFAAADLVRSGHAAELYTGADTGTDPQNVFVGADIPIGRAAHSLGLPGIGLYVYPPLLADLIVPLTSLDLKQAEHLWLGVNLFMLLLTALLLMRLLRVSLRSGGAVLITVAVFCFTPGLQAFTLGQITILLLLLWTAGTVLYNEDRPFAAGALFALATAIKLTPALVLLPFIFWRAWRVLGGFFVALACFALICVWIDTPHTLVVYFTRVMPSMSGAVPDYSNYSLAAATERLWSVLRTGAIASHPVSLAAGAIAAGRIATLTLLATLAALLWRLGQTVRKQDRILILGMLGLMAPILSPVSWFHAYALALVAFVLLWHDALQGLTAIPYLAILTLVSLCLGSALLENTLTLLLFHSQHPVFATWLQFGQLAAAAGLLLYRLWRVAPLDTTDGRVDAATASLRAAHGGDLKHTW